MAWLRVRELVRKEFIQLFRDKKNRPLLFIAPLLVLLSYAIAPSPMNLVFSLPEVIAVAVAVAITGQIAGDGESNWLEGVLLLAVYTILAIVFYFLPVA